MARDRVTKPATGRIKGAALLEFVRWFEAEFGRDRLTSSLLDLRDSARHELGLNAPDDSLRILSSRWYEAEAIHGLLDALVLPADTAERTRMAQQGAAAVMQATLRGIYRILFDWLATPARYARFADKLWSAYYDAGEFVVEHTAPTRVVTHIRDWPSHHPFMCEMHRHVAVEIYAAMGCTDVETRREACIDDGEPECRFVTTWGRRPAE